MKFSNDPLFVSRNATFSPCRRYRYSLDIVWNATLAMAAFIGLNPSTADEFQDDPTIRRCRGFAEREGCGGMRMLNLFAWRDTRPRKMKAAEAPIGTENNLVRLLEDVNGPQIACWGTHGLHLGRHQAMRALLRGLLCFGCNRDGTPKHPLYFRSKERLVPFGKGILA